MRSACVGFLFCLGLLSGCSGKKQAPLPDPVEFKGKLTGAEGKKLVLTFKALDEDVAKRAKEVPAVVPDAKGAFKGKAVPGHYEVTAVPVAQGAQGGAEGPGHHSIGTAPKPTVLGRVEIDADGMKPKDLKYPH